MLLGGLSDGGLGEADEGIQLFAGGAGVDGFGGEIDAVAEISSAAGGDESCGRVGENDFAVCAVFLAAALTVWRVGVSSYAAEGG